MTVMDPVVPRPHRVTDRRVDTADTVTLELAAIGEPLRRFQPGQFAMITKYGVGDVPISLSGHSGTRLLHTVRAVGAVTQALHDTTEGDVVGVRGPFGTAWDVASAAGLDVVVAAGGLGLAPLRPVIDELLADRAEYGRITILTGAREPAELLYRDQYAAWAGQAQVEVTVDRADSGWDGPVGLITKLVPGVDVDPARAAAFVCGPEPMMRFTARALIAQGLPAARIRVSLERTMRCGLGWCGHCQLGPLLICRDGPVVGFPVAEPLMSVREL
ncbi:FAD/NAD(P)-binding protein [Paractinoplanes brasiliensis]|uniref:NAD(P)H-flavin reductase n=1 Tax=Paractinoplanes brasiliensis TaxID=52695 RepID=A0A4R6JMY5_9ACTN|nr:FAD/NAD(P)-binding protein [Actinoplanes brasiliensis]TDO36731.1 NAD(P)H-flavin reductase [Actinoplanes brasiliensis]GID32369.1 oxidoreductase [Actinoplanes brasiliensis]